MNAPSASNSVRRRVSRFGEVVQFLTARPKPLRYIGWVGFENLGDEALFEAVRSYFSSRPLVHHERVHRLAVQRLLDRKRFDYALLGGGTLIRGGYLEAFQAAQLRARSSIAFGTGVQDEAFWSQYPERGVSLPDWVGALESCSYLGVRGPDSAEALERFGLEVEVIGDPACFFARPSTFWTPGDKKVGINIGQSRGQLWGREIDVIQRLAETVRLLVAQGWRPEFFVVWPDDVEITHELVRQAHLVNPTIHYVYDNPHRYVELVRGMTVFVGLKLHASVLALCAAVPTLMLEYRPKCLDFMKSVGLEQHNVRTDMLDAAALVDHVNHLADIGPAISVEASIRMTQFRQLQATRALSLMTDN